MGTVTVARGCGDYSAEDMSRHVSAAQAAQPPPSACGPPRGETSFVRGRAGAYHDQDGYQRPVVIPASRAASPLPVAALCHIRAPLTWKSTRFIAPLLHSDVSPRVALTSKLVSGYLHAALRLVHCTHRRSATSTAARLSDGAEWSAAVAR